jgi:hypothetical protein
VIVVLVGAVCAVFLGRLARGDGQRVILPNPKLLGCRAAECSRLWEDDAAGKDAIYPRQVVVDAFGEGGRPRGVLGLYEKSVPAEKIQAELDRRYGKWAQADNATLPVKLWRVEPENFAIQLSVTHDRTKEMTADEMAGFAISMGMQPRSNIAEAGMKQVIYLAFVGAKCKGE